MNDCLWFGFRFFSVVVEVVGASRFNGKRGGGSNNEDDSVDDEGDIVLQIVMLESVEWLRIVSN